MRDSSAVKSTLLQAQFVFKLDGHRWCLSSSLSLSVGFSIQDEAMDSCPVRATGSSLLPCGRYLLAHLNGN